MRLDSGRTIIGTTALGERHCAFAFSLLEKEYTHLLLSGDLMIVRRTGSKGRKKYICCAQTKRCPLPHKRHKRPKNYVGVFGFNNRHFQITVPVAISQQFFGWVFSLGNTVRISQPEWVRQKMKDMLKEVKNRKYSD